jgi:hypothetical protein
MFSKKSLFVAALLIFTSFLGASVANAQTTSACPYTVASLQGNYAVVVNYGANIAMALGTRNYDGNGNLTGTFVQNAPTTGSTTGARTVTSGKNIGTYTVNCDGTGVISRVTTLATGATAIALDNFVITAALRPTQAGLPMLATAITDAGQNQSTLVPGGLFITRVQNRLPDVTFVYGY